MALVRLGALAQDVRGKMGGIVFSRSAGQTTVRTVVAKVASATVATTRVKNGLTSLSKMWSGTLTAAQRAAWEVFATNYPSTDVFGASKQLSGSQMFNSINQRLKTIGATILLDPPLDQKTISNAKAISWVLLSGANFVRVNTQTMTVPTTEKYYIYGTGPMRAGTAPKKSDYKFVAAITPANGLTNFLITGPWEKVFTTIIAGWTYWLDISFINSANGAVTVGQQISAVAT